MMGLRFKLLVLFFFILVGTYSQVHNVSLVNFKVNNTAQMDAITVAQGKKEGSVCYNTTTKSLHVWTGAAWVQVGSGGGGGGGLTAADIDTFVEINTIVADKNLANTDDPQTYTLVQRFNGTINVGDGVNTFGFDEGALGRRWAFQEAIGEFRVLRQQSESTDAGGSYQTLYVFNQDGSLSSDNDIITRKHLDTFAELDALVSGASLAAQNLPNTWSAQNVFSNIVDINNVLNLNGVLTIDGDLLFDPKADTGDNINKQKMGVDENGYWYFEPVADALGLDAHFNFTPITQNRTYTWQDRSHVVAGIDLNSPDTGFLFAKGTGDALDAATYSDPGIIVEIQTDGDIATDGYVTSISVTGTTTKTITLERNGLPDLTTNFTDDGGGGGGDGNDFLTGVTEASDILTFAVANQTDPTFDLGAYLATKNYWSSSNDGAGSGLDADLLDGLNSLDFLRRTAANTGITGSQQINDNIKYIFGTGSDFEFFHNGTDNIINLINGALRVRDNGTDRVVIQRGNGDISTTGAFTASGPVTGNRSYSVAGGVTLDINPSAQSIGTQSVHDLNITRNAVNKITVGATTTTLQNTILATSLAGSGSSTLQADASGNISRTGAAYAAGTFTPTLIGATTGSYSFTTQVAEYTRMGRMVHFNVILTSVSGTSPTGELRLGGLPLSSGWATQVNGHAIGLSINHYLLLPEVFGSYIRFSVRTSNTATSSVSNADFTAGTLHISGTYMTP